MALGFHHTKQTFFFQIRMEPTITFLDITSYQTQGQASELVMNCTLNIIMQCKRKFYMLNHSTHSIYDISSSQKCECG